MTTDTPVVYAARMDVEPSYLDRFEQWYETKHAPDLLRSGFLSCVAYHAIDASPFVHNFYLIPDVGILSSPTYQSARTPEEDPQRPEVLSNVSSRSNTPYRQHATWGCTADEPVWGAFVATIEFGIEPFDDATISAVEGLLASSHVTGPLRWCIREGVHPNNPQRPAHGLVIAEADSEEAARSAAAALSSLLGAEDAAPGAPRALTVSLLRRTTALAAGHD